LAAETLENDDPLPAAARAEPLAGDEPDGFSHLAVGAPIRGLSFQNRIAVVALITAVSVLIAATGVFVLQEWRTEHDRLVQHETTMARVMAARLATTGGDVREAQVRLQAFAEAPKVRSAVLKNAAGLRVAGYENPDKAAFSRTEAVEVSAPVMVNGRKAGELVVVASSDPFTAVVPRLVALGGSLFFVAAGLALFTGRWLAGRVTKPVNRLSFAMREIARSGDFAQLVERGEDDEFGRLTDSFNALLAQLHRRDLDLRAAMDELVGARDAAQAANILKSQFLANMSHEIRTPLNGVLAMAQIMAMGELTDVQRERLDVISRSGEALLAVLNDILDLSKIEAGRMELEVSDLEAREIASQVQATHAVLAEKKGLKFAVEVTPDAAGVRRGDCPRLLQVLNNLVANAIKFTEAGEVQVLIEGEGPAGVDGLRMTVRDTGIGVAADKLPLLFQKFSQLDASTTRRFGGTGLGLAICRELAHLMGGRIWAESAEGAGSTFHVSVPLVRVADAAPEPLDSAEAVEPGQDEEMDDRPLRVLAAEDNATNQLVLKSVMATFGVELHLVGHGRAAVDAWSQETFDVILMDIQMPEMDGIAATRMIRAAEAETGRARTPIIALSANAMTHQVKEYLAAGMDRHVAKPIELAKLHSALLGVLGAGEGEPGAAAEAGAEAGAAA
jgi:signal transduction histidine kinase/CheY-like chemotaxis protein